MINTFRHIIDQLACHIQITCPFRSQSPPPGTHPVGYTDSDLTDYQLNPSLIRGRESKHSYYIKLHEGRGGFATNLRDNPLLIKNVFKR